MSALDDAARARLERAIEQVTRIASGDFSPRGTLSPALDEIDAIVASLNILAEDFGVERARRQRAEASLEDAVESYESAPGLFCSIDATEGRIVQCNRTMAAWLGWERDRLVGRRLEALYAPGRRAQLAASLAAIAGGLPPPSGDHELLRGDGHAIPALLSGDVVRDEAGAPRRFRLIYRDVSAERQLETQLVHAQKMEGLGRLAGGVAHDFNNLLMAIVGSAEALADLVPSSAAREDVQQILVAAQRGAELTSQLLAFSRRTVTTPSVVDLNDLVANMARMLRRTLDARIELRVVTGPGLWSVKVDSAGMEQVLMNLAVNARDAMPTGGVLTIETRNVPADAVDAPRESGAGEHVLLRVSDDGVGMSGEVRERIFEPFFTTKEVGRGTGLGLAMVYGIVRQAGGTISVQSEPGAGTVFSVHLPRSRDAASRPQPMAQAPPRGGREAILVVEDDALVRRVVVRTLRGGGYDVVEAGDGAAALELCRAHARPFDLVITDLTMPRLGGRELIDALRADALSGRFLLVTGYVEDGEVGGEVLAKPFTPATLLTRVRSLLDSP